MQAAAAAAQKAVDDHLMGPWVPMAHLTVVLLLSAVSHMLFDSLLYHPVLADSTS